MMAILGFAAVALIGGVTFLGGLTLFWYSLQLSEHASDKIFSLIVIIAGACLLWFAFSNSPFSISFKVQA